MTLAVTLQTTIYQPGKTADVTPSQMKAVVYAGGHKPAYDEFKMDAIVHRWADWSDFFGYVRSCTYGQSGHETGWFWSRVEPNQVQPSQNNWGGLGADNTGASGATFGPHPAFPHDELEVSAIDHGIVAFMCHLSLYVHGEPDQWPEHTRKYAPFAYRLKAVRDAHNNTRKPDGTLLGYLGMVKVVGDFVNCRWAETGKLPCGTLANGYAPGIVSKANAVHAQPKGDEMGLSETIMQRIAAKGIEIHDIRGQMARSGLPETRPASAWRYIGVHHTAVSRGVRNLQGDIDSWRNHSTFHVNTRGWPTIAYFLGASLSGRMFLLRDIEIVGYHAFAGANYQTLAICADMTSTNAPTDGLLKAMKAALDVLDESPELPNLIGPTGTYGHQELTFLDPQNSTSCPGALLPWVKEYRQGAKSKDDPNARFFEQTGYWIVNMPNAPMLKLWTDLGGLKSEGYPLGGMALDEDGVYRQLTENSLLEIWPDGTGRRGGLGQRYRRLMDAAGQVQLAVADEAGAV